MVIKEGVGVVMKIDDQTPSTGGGGGDDGGGDVDENRRSDTFQWPPSAQHHRRC